MSLFQAVSSHHFVCRAQPILGLTGISRWCWWRWVCITVQFGHLGGICVSACRNRFLGRIPDIFFPVFEPSIFRPHDTLSRVLIGVNLGFERYIWNRGISEARNDLVDRVHNTLVQVWSGWTVSSEVMLRIMWCDYRFLHLEVIRLVLPSRLVATICLTGIRTIGNCLYIKFHFNFFWIVTRKRARTWKKPWSWSRWRDWASNAKAWIFW